MFALSFPHATVGSSCHWYLPLDLATALSCPCPPPPKLNPGQSLRHWTLLQLLFLLFSSIYGFLLGEPVFGPGTVVTPQDLLLTTQQWRLALLLSRSDGNWQITALAAIMVWAELLFLRDRVISGVQAACPPNLPSNHHLDQNKPLARPFNRFRGVEATHLSSSSSVQA